MKVKRYIAVLLTSTIMLNTLSSSFIASAATTSSNGTDITLSYIKSDENDPKVATIVRGNSTTIKIDKRTAGYTSADPPFTVKSVTGIDQSELIKIQDNLFTGTKDVTTSDKYPTDAEKMTFSIKGNYYALLAEGDAYETSIPDLGTNNLTSVKALSQNAVMEYSEAIITCEAEETETANPRFLLDENSRKGVFKDFDSDDISVKSSTKTMGTQKVIVFQLANGNNVKLFELYPQQIHPVYQTNEKGEFVLDAFGNKIIKSRNNYIAKGTTFRLVFRLPTSNELLLNVLSPQRATQNIADEIMRNDGVINQSYIDLADGDSLNYITQDFKLNSFIDQYGTNFNIDWEWTPDNAIDKDVISIASSGNWRNVAIIPKQTDVRGKLKATVIYKKGSDNPVSTQTKDINILIRGTGEPAQVTQIWQKTGKTEYTFPEDQRTFPNSKEMDVYDGNVDKYTLPNKPYKYRLKMTMGRLNASSQYAKVEVLSGDPSVVSTQTLINSNPADYQFGGQIDNPKKNNIEDNGDVDLEFTALKKGYVKLQITFYVKGNNDKIVKAAVQPKPITINVYDTSPNDDSALKSITLKDQDKKQIDFGFKPFEKQYNIDLPYATESITITPTRNDPQANKIMHVLVTYVDDKGDIVTVIDNKDQESGYMSDQIKLEPNISNKIEITVTAQNPNVQTTYIINVMRLPPSDDSALKSLALYDYSNKNVITGFKPDVFNYKVTVPYKQDKLRVAAEKNNSGAVDPIFNPELKPNGLFGSYEWLVLNDMIADPKNNKTTLKITVNPETTKNDPNFGKPDNKTQHNISVYTVEVTREAPSPDASLAELKVTDALDKAITFNPVFNKENDTYEVHIPYSTDKVKISAKPTDSGAKMVIKNSKAEDDKDKEIALSATAPSKSIAVNSLSKGEPPYHELIVAVTAEDAHNTMQYKLQIHRDEPNTDATLSLLKCVDQDGNNVDIDFNTELRKFNVTVPYEVAKVKFTPTTTYSAVNKITVAGKPVENGKESQEVNLKSLEGAPVKIIVVAEDGKTTVEYEVSFTILPPSTDARLKGLVVTGAEKFNPIFISNVNKYTASVVKDAKGVIITATANHPKATIKINGKKVESGKPSELIDIIELTQDVKIEVTPQDGNEKNVNVYIITISNPNLRQKGSNADLEDLEINYGAMTPAFKPSITTYEVAAKEDTYSVDIIPDARDSYATVKVYAGSKEIGDNFGNYSEAITDGDNEFTVKVTSEDETKTKEYKVTVYRNEEDKQGILKPTTAKDIDYKKSDVIVVDISKYSRVSADVFNELQKYPNKQIVLQGNDYSLQFKASDFKKVIPNTTIYDFGLSFTSPLEDDIMNEIDSYSGNRYAEVVYVYFKHHGELPAKAAFTLSLGKKYANEKLYWHYYNEERERIDYYGYYITNSRGTFTVPLYHMSTYMSVDQRLAGSEDKSSLGGSSNLGTAAGGKINPNTSVGRGN